MRVYTSKLTPDCVVTYLFHDWTQPAIVLPSVARVCDDQSTVHLDGQLVGYSSACVRSVWGINRVCFVFRFGFRASLLALMSWIERLDVCYYCADVWNVLAHFGSEYSGTRPSTGRSGYRSSTACVAYVAVLVTRSSAHRRLLQRLLGLDLSQVVHWCVTQAVCSELWPIITLQTQCWR